MVQAAASTGSAPVKTSVRSKAWKKSAKKGGAVATKAIVDEVEEEEIEEVASAVKDISKVKRKRSKDAKQRRRELAKTKSKDKKKTDAALKET